VREDLAHVVDLQNLDLEIARIQGEVQEIPREIADLEQQLQSARRVWDQTREHLASLEQTRRRHERDLEEITAEQRKRQGRLFEIKTNQEYAAVLKEIEGLKERRSKMEDEILELFDQIEAAQAAVRSEETLYQDREARTAPDLSAPPAQPGRHRSSPGKGRLLPRLSLCAHSADLQ
jgi:predicted  nucleic acid-binding Zn-ribbon protein